MDTNNKQRQAPHPDQPGPTGLQPQYPRRARFTTQIPERRAIPRNKPRAFLLKWNQQNIGKTDHERQCWHECWGTLYPNGRVSLDYGTPYESMADLREHISQIGTYLFHWLSDEHFTLGPGEGTAENPDHPVQSGDNKKHM